MPPRAFVIAIEDYGKGNYLPSLPGCNADADAFIQWLRDKKGVAKESIFCCASKDLKQWRTTGTTASEIIDELARAVTEWADKTDEFYFFFSGHGFSYSTSPWEKSVDVLVASDFKNLTTGGRACLQLNEIKTKLWKSLGPRHHYYFIDACRNLIPADAVAPAGTGLGFPNSQLGTPTIYKMFSTAQGAVAKNRSGFTPLLVKGLNGGGRAKGLRANHMYVVFDLLCEYMKKSLQPNGQDVDYDREGSGEGFILELKPIPQTNCEIHVDNARPADQFTLVVKDIKGFDKQHQFKGDSFKLSLFPDDYSVELKHPSATVVQKEPPPADFLDFYDPLVLRFELQQPTAVVSSAKKSGRATKGGARRGARRGAGATRGLDDISLGQADSSTSVLPEAMRRGLAMRDGGESLGLREVELLPGGATARPRATSASLEVKAAAGTEVEARNLQTGEVLRRVGDFKEEISPGEYVLKLRERGATVSRRQVRIAPGERKTLNLLERPTDKVRATILEAVGAGEVGGASVFSERHLGPLANTDLGLWLSLFGASRILGAQGDFQKLERLQLETFSDMKKDASGVYVLAGFEKSDGGFGVGLSAGAKVKWELLRAAKGLHRIFERRFDAAPGSHLLSLKLPKQPPFTFAVHCLPNRVTLATFAEDADGRLAFHQFMLPVNHLMRHLEPEVRSYLGQNMLGVVRAMTLAQTQFARKRSVQEQLRTNDAGIWRDLIARKWLDPLLALVAAYDVVRHGTIEQSKTLLGLMNSNLRRYFAGMPDVEAIAKLIGAPWQTPPAPPLFFDGVLAFDEVQEKRMLPLSPDKLDYASAWTSWRGAVNDFDASARSGQPSRKTTGAAKKGAAKKGAAKK